MNDEGRRWKRWALMTAIGPLILLEYYFFWPRQKPDAPDVRSSNVVSAASQSPRTAADQNTARIVIEGVTTVAGAPLSGVHLALVSGREEFATLSRAGGFYRLNGVVTGTARLNVWTAAESEDMRFHRSLSMPISFNGDATLHIDPALASGSGAIEGVVLLNGKPRPWALIEARVDLREGSHETIVARTDEAGRYRLAGIPAGLHEVSAQLFTDLPGVGPLPTRYSQRARVETLSPGVSRHDFDFEMGSLTVRLSGIRPFETARVVVARGGPIAGPYTREKVNDILALAVESSLVGTDRAAGFPVVPPGRYTVYLGAYDAEADSYDAVIRTLRVVALPVQLAAGDELKLELGFH